MRATVAVAFGRLGMVCPATLAVQIQPIFGEWCEAIMRFKNNDEKRDAFIGLCNMIVTDPSAFESKLGYLCSAVCSFEDTDYAHYVNLHRQVSQILQHFKSNLGGGWAIFYDSIPPTMHSMRSRLSTFGC